MATSRWSVVSRARYTSPMPPAPSAATISYGPRRVPMLMSRGVEYTAGLLAPDAHIACSAVYANGIDRPTGAVPDRATVGIHYAHMDDCVSLRNLARCGESDAFIAVRGHNPERRDSMPPLESNGAYPTSGRFAQSSGAKHNEASLE